MDHFNFLTVFIQSLCCSKDSLLAVLTLGCNLIGVLGRVYVLEGE